MLLERINPICWPVGRRALGRACPARKSIPDYSTYSGPAAPFCSATRGWTLRNPCQTPRGTAWRWQFPPAATREWGLFASPPELPPQFPPAPRSFQEGDCLWGGWVFPPFSAARFGRCRVVVAHASPTRPLGRHSRWSLRPDRLFRFPLHLQKMHTYSLDNDRSNNLKCNFLSIENVIPLSSKTNDIKLINQSINQSNDWTAKPTTRSINQSNDSPPLFLEASRKSASPPSKIRNRAVMRSWWLALKFPTCPPRWPLGASATSAKAAALVSLRTSVSGRAPDTLICFPRLNSV